MQWHKAAVSCLAQQHRRTRQAVYPKQFSSALVFGNCPPVSRVDLQRCKCSGTRLLSAALAQQHRRTRQAVYPKHCSSALVFGDCTPVSRVDLQRCKCSGTRLQSAALAQQHRRTRQAVYPKQCSSALVYVICTPVCRVDLHRCKCHRQGSGPCDSVPWCNSKIQQASLVAITPINLRFAKLLLAQIPMHCSPVQSRFSSVTQCRGATARHSRLSFLTLRPMHCTAQNSCLLW